LIPICWKDFEEMLAKLAQLPCASSAATAQIGVENKDLYAQWKAMYLFLHTSIASII
jgi:hypothetical protein